MVPPSDRSWTGVSSPGFWYLESWAQAIPALCLAEGVAFWRAWKFRLLLVLGLALSLLTFGEFIAMSRDEWCSKSTIGRGSWLRCHIRISYVFLESRYMDWRERYSTREILTQRGVESAWARICPVHNSTATQHPHCRKTMNIKLEIKILTSMRARGLHWSIPQFPHPRLPTWSAARSPAASSPVIGARTSLPVNGQPLTGSVIIAFPTSQLPAGIVESRGELSRGPRRGWCSFRELSIKESCADCWTIRRACSAKWCRQSLAFWPVVLQNHQHAAVPIWISHDCRRCWYVHQRPRPCRRPPPIRPHLSLSTPPPLPKQACAQY